jgi:hypothetical protein
MRLKWSWNRSWADKRSKPQMVSAKAVGAMRHERFLECSVAAEMQMFRFEPCQPCTKRRRNLKKEREDSLTSQVILIVFFHTEKKREVSALVNSR